MKIPTLALLLAIAAGAGAQSPATATGTASATITVQPYVSVLFNSSNPISFVISDGGTGGTYAQSAGFTVYSNCRYTVSAAVTSPQTSQGATSPGSFSASTNLTGTQQPTSGQTGSLTVTISGLSVLSPPGTYASGGSAVVTVTEAP